jgi:4'-phosphopantetheinyl transferase
MWEETDVVPPLGDDEVHVWHVRLDAVSPGQWALLSPDEQARAGQYRFEVDRNRFASCRATLRRLLGEYLNEPPERLTFKYGPQGKPAPADFHDRIRFNVSHSGDAGLLAFAREREVGVDIECLRTQIDFEDIAERFMSPGEAAYVRGAADRARALYACWTRKEAWMKAIGCGLEEPLARFDTSAIVEKPVGAVAGDDFPGLSWTVYELSPADDLLGAAAVEGSSVNIRQLRSGS